MKIILHLFIIIEKFTLLHFQKYIILKGETINLVHSSMLQKRPTIKHKIWAKYISE